jgi:hypothetical protein
MFTLAAAVGRESPHVFHTSSTTVENNLTMPDPERTHHPARRTSTRRSLGAVGIVVLFLVSLAVVTRDTWYTPSTTAYVRNDTPLVVTLDDCADNAVTVMPGAQEEIRPFADASHGACKVFGGGTDQGSWIGCLVLASSHGRTSTGAVARVSTTRRSLHKNRCP